MEERTGVGSIIGDVRSMRICRRVYVIQFDFSGVSSALILRDLVIVRE